MIELIPSKLSNNSWFIFAGMELAVTAVASICDVVAELIVFNCAAVLPVASSAEIVILYAFDPVRVTKLETLSEGSMNPVTSPLLKDLEHLLQLQLSHH